VETDVRVAAGTTEDTTNYPALYVAAAATSRRARRNLTWLSAGDITFSLLATLLALSAGLLPQSSSPARPTPIDIILAATAIPFVVSITLRLFAMASGFDRDWYAGRAVAETVKSMTWRYQMATKPYHGNGADKQFADDIGAVLRQSNVRQVVNDLSRLPLQITDQMRASRGQEVAARTDRYMNERLLNQAAWYQQRSQSNRRTANTWFWLSIVFQIGAVTTAIVALVLGADANRGSDLLRLMGIFATFSLAGTAWSERRRYGELADTYSVTLQELLLAASVAQGETGELATLERAVDDGENAILREHRVWLARRATFVEESG